MSLAPLITTPGAADNAPTGAAKINLAITEVNSHDTQIATNTTNIATLQTAVSGLGAGSTNVYLSIYPGIDKTGVTDSRAALILAFASVAGTNKTLVCDCLVYIAVGFDNTKTIYVPSGVNLLFTPAGAFILDSIGVPTFAFGKPNCTWTNYTIQYIGNFGGTALQYTGAWATANSAWNTTNLTAYMAANNGNTFTGGVGATAIWPGPTNTAALNYIFGPAANINFVGTCKATATFATADRFIPVLFSLNFQWATGQAVVASAGVLVTPINATTAVQPTNITFDGWTIDGCCMSFVGTCSNLKMRNITSLRYGDLEDSAGNNQGGIGTGSGRSGNLATDVWFAPPHLFYLQSTNAFFQCSVDYLNILDEGVYTSSNPNYGSRRSRLSGYIQSLKMDPTGLTTIKNYICKRPDGFTDVLGNPAAGVGCFMDSVDIALDCGVGAYVLIATAAVNVGATSFTVTGANWPANNVGGSYSGVASGTYMTQFSSGELRSVTYTVTIVSGNATTVAAAWTQALLNNNTTTVRMGISGCFAFRFPTANMQDVFFRNVKILDTAAVPLNYPILSDASAAHVNLFADFQVIVQDYPPHATYIPGFGIAGEGVNIKCKTIWLNCSSTQTLRGPIVNTSTTPTNDHFVEHELHGWRQSNITFAVAPTGTSANLVSACWQTGVVGWIYPSGTYNVLFSDNEVRAVTFTLGSVACTWTGALSGAPTVNASVCLINSAQFDNFKPLIQLARTSGKVNFGVRGRVVDISNGVELNVNQGLIEEAWTQYEQVTPAAAATYTSIITYPTTFAIDRAAWGVTTTFGTIASCNMGMVAGTATSLFTGLTTTTAAGAKPITTPVTVTGAVLLTPNVNFDGTGVGVIMTRGVRTALSA